MLVGTMTTVRDARAQAEAGHGKTPLHALLGCQSNQVAKAISAFDDEDDRIELFGYWLDHDKYVLQDVGF